jgi:hypothetical protein
MAARCYDLSTLGCLVLSFRNNLMCDRRFVSLALLAILLSANAGCGPTGPKLYPVSGTVTWNGQPLPEGDIIFAPASPGDLEDAGKIVAGKFAFQARPGAKKVKIMANRSEGPVDPQMGLAPRVQYIPPQYSSAEKTTLTAEVTENGKNEFEFSLTGP